jgi:MOSC domain-containing protein YiiM
LLLDRGGIRARVVHGGTIRIGDAITPDEVAAATSSA